MDMQGTPVGNSAQGNKNTSDPERYNNPTTEGAGAVASDSLAAESTRAGGAFAENRDSDPLSVEGSKSTLNNTDTSSATTLAAAPNAQARGIEADSNDATKYPEQAGGQGSFGGTHSDQGYVGGPSGSAGASSGAAGSSGSRQTPGQTEAPFGTEDTDTSNHGVSGASAAKAMGNPSDSSSNDNTSSTRGNTSKNNFSVNNDSSSGSGSGSGSGDNVHVDTAPSYVHSEADKSGKPHGKNITEGGFDSDDKNNASFNTDIGDKNDPALKAEGDFQKISQTPAGGGPRQGGRDGGNYEALNTEQNL